MCTSNLKLSDLPQTPTTTVRLQIRDVLDKLLSLTPFRRDKCLFCSWDLNHFRSWSQHEPTHQGPLTSKGLSDQSGGPARVPDSPALGCCGSHVCYRNCRQVPEGAKGFHHCTRAAYLAMLKGSRPKGPGCSDRAACWQLSRLSVDNQ